MVFDSSADCKWQSRLCLFQRHWGCQVHPACLLGSPPRRRVLRIQGWWAWQDSPDAVEDILFRGRSSVVCCLWWSRGSGPPSHWQWMARVSRWSLTWMGPSPTSHQGIHVGQPVVDCCRRKMLTAVVLQPGDKEVNSRVRPWIVTWRACASGQCSQSPFWRMLSEWGVRCQVYASGKNQGSHNYPENSLDALLTTFNSELI